MSLSLSDLGIYPIYPQNKSFAIGCIGAGFIMRDCHLVAYRNAGFNPVAIASLSYEESSRVASRFLIPNVYNNWKDLLDDKSLEIIDIAVPPDKQLEIVRYAATKENIKGILCQKPLAMEIDEAKEIVSLCDEAGIKLGVNSNMRYDHSIRALKTLIEKEYLGKVILASIELRAIPHWQTYLQKYNKIEILNMGIHHVDTFRFLFGNPERITALTRVDPRTSFEHIDGISQYTFQYKDDLMATSLDDVWAWPGEGCCKDNYIKWRVVGLDGMAQGTIGWPAYPIPQPSTIMYTKVSQ